MSGYADGFPVGAWLPVIARVCRGIVNGCLKVSHPRVIDRFKCGGAWLSVLARFG